MTQLYAVPLMLFASSFLMALAWLGHIRFRRRPYGLALLTSWLIVLPEYMLNIAAIRWGHEVYEGSEMAAMNLTSGVLCVALVAHVVLGERLLKRQILGFAMMAVAVALVVL